MINAADYGCVGDAATINDAALLALRDDLSGQEVTFPPGEYWYTNSRWLWGVDSVTINAYGAKFKNVTTDNWHANQRPFNMHTPWDDDGDVAETFPKNYTSGVLLDGILQDGRVLIYGFNQQNGGFPPNARYYQWNTVTNGQFDDPLKWNFSTTGWPDYQYVEGGTPITFGAARVLHLERSNYHYAKYVEINGAEFLPSPNQNPSDALLIEADTFILKDVKAVDVVPSINRVFLAENCQFQDAEPDKICGEVTFRNCTFAGEVKEATGVDKLILDNCSFGAASMRMAPKEMEITNCSFTNIPGAQYGVLVDKEVWPCNLIKFRNNKVQHDGNLKHVINNAFAQTVNVGAIVDGDIYIHGNDPNSIRFFTVGTYFFSDTDSGEVTNIKHNGADWIVSGTWQGIGTDWKCYPIRRYEEFNTKSELPIFRFHRPEQNTFTKRLSLRRRHARQNRGNSTERGRDIGDYPRRA